jgi:hypothetical protein
MATIVNSIPAGLAHEHEEGDQRASHGAKRPNGIHLIVPCAVVPL